MAWSTHTPVKCVLCGKVRPRVIYRGGKAHRRCIFREENWSAWVKSEARKKAKTEENK